VAHFVNHLGTFRSGSLFILDEAQPRGTLDGTEVPNRLSDQLVPVPRLSPRFEHRWFLVGDTAQRPLQQLFQRCLEILDTTTLLSWRSRFSQHRRETVVRRTQRSIREIQVASPIRPRCSVQHGTLTVPEDDTDGLTAHSDVMLDSRLPEITGERLVNEASLKNDKP